MKTILTALMDGGHEEEEEAEDDEDGEEEYDNLTRNFTLCKWQASINYVNVKNTSAERCILREARFGNTGIVRMEAGDTSKNYYY